MYVQKEKMSEKILPFCMPPEVTELYPSHELWLRRCILEGRECFVARDNQEICGCAIVKKSMKYPNQLKICFFYIRDDKRNKGCAGTLLNQIVSYAKEIGAKRIYLTVNEHAHSSMRRFCYKHQFYVVGKSKKDDVFMRDV